MLRRLRGKLSIRVFVYSHRTGGDRPEHELDQVKHRPLLTVRVSWIGQNVRTPGSNPLAGLELPGEDLVVEQPLGIVPEEGEEVSESVDNSRKSTLAEAKSALPQGSDRTSFGRSP